MKSEDVNWPRPLRGSWGIEMVKTENRNPGEMFHFRVYHSFASPASEALLLSSSSAQPSCRRRSLVFIPLVAIRYPLVDVHLHTTHRPQRHRQLSTDDGKRKIAGKKGENFRSRSPSRCNLHFCRSHSLCGGIWLTDSRGRLVDLGFSSLAAASCLSLNIAHFPWGPHCRPLFSPIPRRRRLVFNSLPPASPRLTDYYYHCTARVLVASRPPWPPSSSFQRA